MRLSLITIKRRPDSDDVSRRETLLEGSELRVGRGADVDVNLPDVNVAYHHATISEGPGGLVISGVGGELIEVNGKSVESVALTPGTTCRIGMYELTGENAPDHADGAIALQKLDSPVGPGKDAPQRIVETLPSRRRLSWIAVLVVLGLFVAWPLTSILMRGAPDSGAVVVTPMTGSAQATVEAAQFAIENGLAPEATVPNFTPMEASWISGPMSRAHAGLAEDCNACHLRPFEMTTNNSCLACHAEVAQHAEVADHPVMALDNYRCAACHKEHVGGESPIEQASAVCTDCHVDLKTVSEKTDLMNVSDFGANHPQFRPTLVTGVSTDDSGALVPTTERRPLDQPYPLVEKSGLKFPHNVHLNKEGVRGLGRASDKTWDMNCASCHVAQADGMLMRPIEMERDCAYCHELTFQPENIDFVRELPHAKASEVSEIVHDYYAARVLEGGLTVPGAPTSARRRPGAPMTPAERAEGLEWAAAQAELELRAIMDVRLCGDCHVAEASAEPDDRGRTAWKVQGALLQRHWMPKSEFNHEPHFAMDCVSCHEATTSKTSADVLMPEIAICRDCHLGEETSQASASSECLACHQFHIEGYGPMSPAHGEAVKARRTEVERSTVVRTSQ
ncbi:MAG: cytochrome c3 family protein [Pseudomonadota bacterium]